MSQARARTWVKEGPSSATELDNGIVKRDANVTGAGEYLFDKGLGVAVALAGDENLNGG
jgi:hypothetical protein